MKSTLIDLWHGNISPLSDGAVLDPNEKKLYEYLDRHYNDLEKLLDEKGRTILEKFRDCYTEILINDCDDAFVQGFSLAVKLMAESMT